MLPAVAGAAPQTVTWDVVPHAPRCDDPDAVFDQACDPSTEKALVVESLTFEPFVETVPEPALTVLLATGVAGLVRRRLGRRSTYR